MSARVMKFIGIVVMFLAHPLGYRMWLYIVTGPFGYEDGAIDELATMLIGIGILEIFLLGLSLFAFGVLKDDRK